MIIKILEILALPFVMLLIYFLNKKDEENKDLKGKVGNTNNQMGIIIKDDAFKTLPENIKIIVLGVQESTSGIPMVTPLPDSDENNSEDKED